MLIVSLSVPKNIGLIRNKWLKVCGHFGYTSIVNKVFLLILSLVVLVGYLSLSYAKFYNLIGEKGLLPPVGHEYLSLQRSDLTRSIRYVALGDSLTEGVGATNQDSVLAVLLAKQLAVSQNVELLNLAHRGDTTEELLRNQLPRAVELKPDLVTIMIGTNDLHNFVSLEVFEQNIKQTLEELKQIKARIVLINIPFLGSPKSLVFPHNIWINLRTQSYNQVLRSVARDANVEYIDLYSLTHGFDGYSEDLFHPSDQGYLRWGELIDVN